MEVWSGKVGTKETNGYQAMVIYGSVFFGRQEIELVEGMGRT